MILDEIVAAKRRAHELRDRQGRKRAEERLADAPSLRPFTAAIGSGPRPAFVSEFKRRSPSAGAIRESGDVATIAREYEAAGARALSILTDEEFFGGRLADLAAARAATSLPILRKDFALFEDDLVEARAAGADAVLLIVRILDGNRLPDLLRVAGSLGLAALVEVHSEEECRRAVGEGARLIGVNHRDLDTLGVDLSLSSRLAPLFPDGVVRVAESGLKSAAEIRAVCAAGYHAVLIGESLLRAPSPGNALAALHEAAR